MKCGCCAPLADLVNRTLCRSKQVCSARSCFCCGTCCGIVVLFVLLWCFLVPALVADMVIARQDCNGIKNGNVPTAFYTAEDFAMCGRFRNVDLTSYFMDASTYINVTFSSRDGFEGLKGWWFRNASSPTSRTVILVHGMTACKSRYEILLPASMLVANGFNAFAMDIREHGNSPSVTGYLAAGCLEYPDVLGAFDFLLGQGIPAGQIGFFAVSLGSPNLLIAFGEEPRITTGMWFDSPAYGFYEAAENGVNEIFKGTLPFGMVWHYMKLKTSCNMDERSAQNGFRKGSEHVALPRIKLAWSEVDTKTPSSLPQTFAQDAKLLGFDVDVYSYDTSIAFAWGSNVFPDQKADTKCREHVTQMLVNPRAYEKELVAFFQDVL